MLFISHIKLRNFKSFRFANISLPQTFLCLAGPNGSGKSNVLDGIRFVLGEMSLKSLRAKKVRDLIYAGANAAEVQIVLEGNDKYEIRRAIRNDGKMLYKLNGKKTTRWVILESLKKHNLDESGRNTIAQGEVQRIINMNGKERRTIVDSVAGISDFEEKKKDTIKELDVVDGRIKDANLVLGERIAFLNELGKEREIALQFLNAKKRLTNAKGSLLKMEMTRYEKELNNIMEIDIKLKFKLDEKEVELKVIEEKIKDAESKRSKSSQQLQLKQQTAPLIKKVEELKASINVKTWAIDDKEQYLKKIDDESTIMKENNDENLLIKLLVTEIDDMKKELSENEREKGEETEKNEVTYTKEIRKNLEEVKTEYNKIREHFLSIEFDIKAKNEIIETKRKELESIKDSQMEEDSTKIKKEIETFTEQSAAISQEIENSFQEIRKINAEVVEFDKKLLELREKSSLLKFKSLPSSANSALNFVNTLKQKGEIGIYGCIADLIKFDLKYTTAIEAAAGGRLAYVVVNNIDTATRIIEKIKGQTSGRVTFIPLKEIKTSTTQPKQKRCYLSSLITYASEIKKAVDFVFGDTILTESTEEAKKLGGNYRIVTVGGEVFERSGLVSGGKIESNILLAAEARKLEQIIEEIKLKKDEMTKKLLEIRQHETALRAQKIDIDIKIKTHEIRSKVEEERKNEYFKAIERKKKLTEEMQALQESIKNMSKRKCEVSESLTDMEKRILSLSTKLSENEEKIKIITDEVQKKRTAKASKTSMLKATIDGKIKELELRKEDLYKKQIRLKEIEKEKKEAIDKINEIKRQISTESEELRYSEEKISKYSKEIEQLFEQMKECDLEIQKLGVIMGEKKIEIDKVTKETAQLAVKKATVETRLSDISIEFAGYSEFEFLNLKKDELSQIIKESEEELATLENINLASIDAYDKKKSDIKEIEEKIGKLSDERRAIFNMIDEIEEKKKVAFFEAFDAINDNFKKMFDYVDIGNGYLQLENHADPFNSNLYIRIRRVTKEHLLDSLSGGESSLVALMFIFAIQFFKPSPFYILDEVDASLDKENSKRLAHIIAEMSKDSQFLVASHNDIIMSEAHAVLGVTRVNNVSTIVGVKLEKINT